MQNKDEFDFQFLREEKVQQYAEVIGKQFSLVEPYLTLRIPAQSYTQRTKKIISTTLKDKLSIGLRHRKTKLLAGCLIAMDLFSNVQKLKQIDLKITETKDNKKYSGFDPLFRLMDAISCEYREKIFVNKQLAGKYAQLYVCAIAEQFQKKGLSRKLLDQQMILLKQRNYRYAVCQFVSPFTISTYVNSSQYFKEVKSIYYKDFQYQNNKIFQHIPGKVMFADCELDKINIDMSKKRQIY